MLQYINQYDGGVAGFAARAHELAERYGSRFEPPASLLAKAELGERYADEDRVLAKSGYFTLPRGAWERSGLPSNWRHEALSVRLARTNPRC